MREEKKLDVYNEKVEELYKRLETNINGLSEIEAKKRLERDGENKLEERKKKSNLMLFLGQFNDFMIKKLKHYFSLYLWAFSNF